MREPGSQEAQLLLKDTAVLSDAPEAAASASKGADATDSKGKVAQIQYTIKLWQAHQTSAELVAYMRPRTGHA